MKPDKISDAEWAVICMLDAAFEDKANDEADIGVVNEYELPGVGTFWTARTGRAYMFIGGLEYKYWRHSNGKWHVYKYGGWTDL